MGNKIININKAHLIASIDIVRINVLLKGGNIDTIPQKLYITAKIRKYTAIFIEKYLLNTGNIVL